MHQYEITAPSYAGAATITYTTNGILAAISVAGTSMPPEVITKFKALVPTLEADVTTIFAATKATVVQVSYTVTFEQWWQLYNHKINRKRCLPLWAKLSNTKQVLAYHGIAKYDKYLAATGYRKKCDPENYLRNEMWDNDWQ